MFPFTYDSTELGGHQYDCVQGCINERFDKGPFIKDLGPIPEGAIPKKFIWATGDAATEVPEL